ncbi:hypothetical protein ACNFJN_00595 [Xenorhabdus budapestensis]|uniref:hypothetical protein n=1 Tax=Xenorhabdus budapestensis TaxID=290110 RepID=UPI003A8B0A3A
MSKFIIMRNNRTLLNETVFYLTPEQKAMLMVLLAETKSPDSLGTKYDEKEDKDTMQYMHDALLNRVKSPKAHELDVPKHGNKLIGLISGPRTIEGFQQ